MAILVYNHAAHDARVLKIAASLRTAGAQVRIFAVARARAGYPEGSGLVGEDLEVDRAPELELARHAPWLLRLARRLTGRENQMPAASAFPATGQPPRRADPASTSRRAPSVSAQVLEDVWLRTYRTLSLVLFWWHAHRAALRWAPDVVHACDGNTLVPAMTLGRQAGARVVYDAHELWCHRNVRPDRPVAPWVESAIERAGIRRAAGVITVSPSIAAWLHRRYRLAREPTLVRNAPPARSRPGRSVGQDVPSALSLRARAGIPEDTQVLGYAGRITTSRGLEETLTAMAVLPATVHLVMLGYGEPDYLRTLDAHADDLGLSCRVHRVPPVAPDEVPVVLADADVSVVIVQPVCLSYRYSLPNKLFESIHAGVPVVAADLPDLAALVLRYGVGEVVDPSRPELLADAITRVLADPHPYRRAARDARREVSWGREEAALLDLYTRVLNR